MAVGEVHHVAVIVSDLDRSVRFYEEGLGYRRTLSAQVGGESVEQGLALPPGTTGRIQYMQGPSRIGQLELIEWSDGPGTQPRSGHSELGPFLLSFEVPKDEIDELFAKMRSLGAETTTDEVGVSVLENYGPIGVFVCKDPDGNLLEFVSLPTRDEIEEFRLSNANAEA